MKNKSLERSTSISSSLFQRLTKGDITSTAALVEELNTEQNAFERQPLREWVQSYINWFSKQPIEGLTIKLIREYLILGEIRSNGPSSRELLQEWFCSLCNRIHQGAYGEKKLIEALDSALQSIDKRVFRDDPSLLLKLANELLNKLDPSTCTFTKETYATHSTVLFALHQTFLLIQHVAPKQLDPNQATGMYAAFKKRLTVIAKGAHYYPFCYQAKLISLSVHRLKMEKRSFLQARRRRLISGVKGVLYIMRTLRTLLELDFDVEAFEHGYENLQEAFAKHEIEEKSWHDWIQALNHASLQTLDKPDQFVAFESCYKTLRSKESSMRNREDRKALRYGIICQLQMLAMHGSTNEVKLKCKEELISIAEKFKADSSWSQDQEIVEALLDALSCLYNQRNDEDVFVALEILLSIPERNVSAATTRWLENASLKEKLSVQPDDDTVPESGCLFRHVRKKLLESMSELEAHSSPELYQMQNLLKQHYQRSQFTKMDALFEGEAPKHIGSIQCHLMLLEQVKVRDENGTELDRMASNEEDEDHVSAHYERLEWVKTDTSKEELFKERSLEPDQPARDINKILVTGDPGTGKTTLARHLAFIWAIGEWGDCFEFVFFLRVRELQATKYNDSSDRREETLATAIANNCFPRRDRDSYQTLRDQINEVLEKPTTLVILDGLDEGAGASEAIISEAKDRACKLLMLSRPYGIQEDRSLSDIEVVLTGLNDDQLEALVESELSEDQADELLDFLKATPIIWKIAHVSVNARILCTLWKDPHLKDFKSATSCSLSMLYRRMTHFTWQRYELKMTQECADAVEVFDMLGRIAYEALNQGQILIDEWLVQDHARTRQMKRLLKESGFLLLQSVGMHYQFPHLTFQDYFAGRWLGRQFCMGLPEEKEMVKDVLAHQKYNEEFRLVLSFMMGEVSLMRGLDGAEKLLEVIDNEPREILGIEHLFLQLRLINDHLSTATKQHRKSGFDAVSRLMEVLRECEGGEEYQLCCHLTSLLESIPSVLQSYPEVLEPVLELSASEEKRFRNVAFTTVIEVIRFIPDSVPFVQDSMQRLFCESDENVREEIIGFCRELALILPNYVSTILPLTKLACEDEDHRVRESAFKGLAAIVRMSHPSVPSVMHCLQIGCHDELYTVRRAGLCVIKEIIIAEPERTPVLMPNILEACWDKYEQIRDAAVLLSERIIEHVPQYAPQLLEAMKTAVEDVNPEVRKHIIEAIVELLHVVPDQCRELVDAFSEACNDRSIFVREAAMRMISEAIQLTPELFPVLIQKLKGGVEDEFYSARKASIRAIGEIIPHASEEEISEIAVHLRQGFQDKDFLVRIAAVEAVGDLLDHAPTYLPQFIDRICQAYQNEEVYTVRKAAIEVIGSIIDTAPDQSTKLMELLRIACNDSYTVVRKTALENISKSMIHIPEYLPELVASLRDSISASNANTRKGSIEMIGELIKVVPEETPELLKMLMVAFEDPNQHARKLTIEALANVGTFPEDQISVLVGKLFGACLDTAPTVRKTSMKRLSMILHGFPATCLKVIDQVKRACTHRKDYARRAAFEIMRDIVCLHPEKIPELIEIVRAGCEDDLSRVRQAALWVVEEIMMMDLEQFEQLVDLLFSSCADLHGRVRSTVVKTMGMALDYVPEVFPMFLEPLVSACEDVSFYTRKSAFQIIEKAISSHPQLIPHFIAPLLTAFHQRLQQDRLNSRDSMQKIPLEALIDFYWTTEMKTELAFVLVSRLHHTPVTITPSNGQCQKLILHHSTHVTEWEKPIEDVQEFLNMIQTTYQQRMDPTLTQI